MLITPPHTSLLETRDDALDAIVDALEGASREGSPGARDIQSLRTLPERDGMGLHLATFHEPYLTDVLAGQKTVDSRFSMRRCAPYGQIRRGDVVLLKRLAGPVVGACRAGDVRFYRLSPSSWTEIVGLFGEAIRAGEGFLESRQGAAFATLIQLENVRPLRPMPVSKRDRRGWVVVRSGASQLQLPCAE